MKKIALILFAVFTMLGSARAQSSGEYKAFVYNRPTGCIGQTTEEGLVPDCYDATQNWARYTWSYGLKHYVPANQPLLTVAKLPTATDISSFPAFAVVSDSLNACVAGNTLAGSGTFVCPVFNNGVSWQLLGLTGGGGGGGVTIVNAGADITVTGPTNSPVVNVANSGVTAGTYTVSTITVNAQGIITSASSGSVGSVTSVGLTMPAQFSVAGSPVTSSGTLAVTLANENANTFFGGPVSGAAAAPTFRLLGAYDVPGNNIPVPNSATGTTLNKLVKFTAASPSTAIITSAGDTSGIKGVCIQGCGTTGTAIIQQSGQVSCIFDGATTANHYVQQSLTVNGDCTDGGATYPTSGEVLGIVESTNGSGGTYVFDLFTPDVITSTGASKVPCTSLPTFTGDVNNVNCAMTVKGVQGNPLAPNRVTTSGATLSVNLSTSLNQFITLHDTITLSFSAAPADGNVVRIKLTQSNGGSHTVTWPAAVQWASANAPTLTTTNGQADLVQCLYDATTTNYMCSAVLNFTP